MKRDPRLRRLGERRGERRLHGAGRLTTLGLYRALGMTPHFRELADGFVALADASRRVQEAWVEHVLAPHARLVAEQLTAECGMPVSYAIEPVWPEKPLTQAQADRLDDGWGPGPSELA